MWILVVRGAEPPQIFRLTPGADRTVGRGPHADFIVDDSLASRMHCRLTATDDGLLIADLGSTNGTFVNGSRQERATLDDGDRLRLGRVEIDVRRDKPQQRRGNG